MRFYWTFLSTAFLNYCIFDKLRSVFEYSNNSIQYNTIQYIFYCVPQGGTNFDTNLHGLLEVNIIIKLLQDRGLFIKG